MQSVFCFDRFSQVIIKVFGCITKRSEDDNLLVALIDRIGKLIAKVGYKLLQLAVVFRSNIRQHQQQQIKVLHILLQISTPSDMVKVL